MIGVLGRISRVTILSRKQWEGQGNDKLSRGQWRNPRTRQALKPPKNMIRLCLLTAMFSGMNSIHQCLNHTSLVPWDLSRQMLYSHWTLLYFKLQRIAHYIEEKLMPTKILRLPIPLALTLGYPASKSVEYSTITPSTSVALL